MVPMTVSIESDARLDPRLRAFLAAIPSHPLPDVESREQLLAEVNSPSALAMRESMSAFMDLCDSEDVAPTEGLTISTTQFVSQPDGNSVNLQITRPDTDEPLPCVYYIHGGGMAHDVLLRRDVPGLGQAHRGQRRRRGHGRLPQLRGRLLGAGGGAVPRRA